MHLTKSEARITRGGQISIPAAVRRRWATDRVIIEDTGDSLVVRPMPPDPIAAAIGSLRLPERMTSDDLRARARTEEGSGDIRRRAGCGCARRAAAVSLADCVALVITMREGVPFIA